MPQRKVEQEHYAFITPSAREGQAPTCAKKAATGLETPSLPPTPPPHMSLPSYTLAMRGPLLQPGQGLPVPPGPAPHQGVHT